jgi:hypothetical protein
MIRRIFFDKSGQNRSISLFLLSMKLFYQKFTDGRFRLTLIALTLLAVSVLTQAQTFTQSSIANKTTLKLLQTRMYGTASNDLVSGIVTDAQGNVYLAGNAREAELSGFLRKYTPSGTLLWEKSKSLSSIAGIALDKSGNCYVSGSYYTGSSRSQRYFIYIEKYDSLGNVLWTRNFAAPVAPDPTQLTVNGIAVDSSGNGSVVILFELREWPYQASHAHLRKYNLTSGNLMWETWVGRSSPYTSRPVFTVDRLGKIITAVSTHSLNRDWNTTISHYDKQGKYLKSFQFFPPNSNGPVFENKVHSITSDLAGNVYISGITKGDVDGPSQGLFDGFVRKYDSDVNVLWTKKFGTVGNDYANGVITDATGNVYVVGSTSGNLVSPNRGSYDAVILKYGVSGELLHASQLGGPLFDVAMIPTIDPNGNLIVAGNTTGSFVMKNQGLQDLCFIRFSVK